MLFETNGRDACVSWRLACQAGGFKRATELWEPREVFWESLQAAEFGYKHDSGPPKGELSKHATDLSQGMRHLGTAAVQCAILPSVSPPPLESLALESDGHGATGGEGVTRVQ